MPITLFRTYPACIRRHTWGDIPALEEEYDRFAAQTIGEKRVMGWYTRSESEYDPSGKIHLADNWREMFQGVVNDDYMSGRNEITGLSA